MRKEHVLNVRGRLRALISYTPPQVHPRPDVFLLLHGSTSTPGPGDPLVVHGEGNGELLYPALRFERNYETEYFEPHRRGRNIIQMYLAATQHNGWYCWGNGGGASGSCDHGEDVYANDEKFVSDAIHLVNRSFPFDIGRVFIFGSSGGGTMAWRLGCSPFLAERIDGIGVVGGFLSPQLRQKVGTGRSSQTCSDLLVAMFHGTMDEYVPIALADETFDWFAGAHLCNDTTATIYVQHDVEVRLAGVPEYNPGTCSSGSQLGYFRIDGGGHTIPGAPHVWDGLGPTSTLDSMAAMRFIWFGEDLPETENNFACPSVQVSQSAVALVLVVWLWFRLVLL